MIIKNADVFNEKGFFEKRDVYIDDELFSEKSKDLNVLDGSNCYLIPLGVPPLKNNTVHIK